jgi:hypothetical protein
MMDYQGFWHGFLVLFVVLPVLVGASLGLIWGWRNGRRGTRLMPAALFGAGATGLIVFGGAVLLFRA